MSQCLMLTLNGLTTSNQPLVTEMGYEIGSIHKYSSAMEAITASFNSKTEIETGYGPFLQRRKNAARRIRK
jgi:hypothetical protein